MCHPDAPPGSSTPRVDQREVTVDLLDGERMPALHVSSETGGPGVLLIADVFGRSPFYEHLAALLATAGFDVLLPDFFFRQGPLAEVSKDAAFARRAKLDEANSVDDLRFAAHWLREHCGGQPIATLGFCMGGTFALDLASTETDLVTVAYYGFPSPTSVSPPPPPLDLVDDLRGPVLAIWGDQDAAVGLQDVEHYVELATAANPQFTADIIPGLGHGFLGSADLNDESDPAAASWRRTLAYLDQHLQTTEVH